MRTGNTKQASCHDAAPCDIEVLAGILTSKTATSAAVQCDRTAQKDPEGESTCQQERRQAISSLLTVFHVGEFQQRAGCTQSCTVHVGDITDSACGLPQRPLTTKGFDQQQAAAGPCMRVTSKALHVGPSSSTPQQLAQSQCHGHAPAQTRWRH